MDENEVSKIEFRKRDDGMHYIQALDNNNNIIYDGIKYNDNNYLLIMDAFSMDNGENQYRLQRLELKNAQEKTGDYDGDGINKDAILPPNSQPVSGKGIPQNNENVNLKKVLYYFFK